MSTLIMMGRAKEWARRLFEPGDTLSQRVVRGGFWVFALRIASPVPCEHFVRQGVEYSIPQGQPGPNPHPHHRPGSIRFRPDGDCSLNHVHPGDLHPDGLPDDFGLGGGRAV